MGSKLSAIWIYPKYKEAGERYVKSRQNSHRRQKEGTRKSYEDALKLIESMRRDQYSYDVIAQTLHKAYHTKSKTGDWSVGQVWKAAKAMETKRAAQLAG